MSLEHCNYGWRSSPHTQTPTKRTQLWLVGRSMALLLLGALFLPLAAGAATVWTGPKISFSKANGADSTLPANQDRMTPNVWITRDEAQGIYNAALETGFTHFLSPTNTEWADGTTANYSTLTYYDWNTWAKSLSSGHFGPPSTIGVNAVVHLISEDIYIDIKFTSWNSSGVGGGFSYMRSTPAGGNTPPSVTITNPANNAVFIAPANVTIQATASDSDGSVTNVQFFDGVNSLGNVTSSPYQVSVNLAVGSHSLTAVASDNSGATTTSSAISVTVNTNAFPSVAITNPVNNAVFIAPANVTIQATASDSDGSVTNVQFFDGANSLGNVASSPYQVSVGLAVGSHTLTAVASDNRGATNTSSAITVTVNTNTFPSVTITNPVDGAVFIGPTNLTIQATASDSDGSVTNVQFFDGANSLGNATSSPYQVSAGFAVGSHSLTAVATDNLGASTTSSPPVMVTVNANTAPSVSITNPVNGAYFTAPANVTVQAAASDSDGSVANVEFFNGATSAGVDSTSPYAVTLTGLSAGSYTLSAVATDNLNATATNSITITVTNPPPTIVTPRFSNGAFSFSLLTHTGYTYTVEFTLSLTPINWETFTNFPGDGSTVQISDSTATNSRRYYRVGAAASP